MVVFLCLKGFVFLSFQGDTHGDTRRCLLGCFWPVSRWLKKPSKFVALSPTNGNVIVIDPPDCNGVVITTTPLMDQSICCPIISLLTFEELSPHFCGDGVAWQFDHTEGFLPIPPAITPPRIRVVMTLLEDGAQGKRIENLVAIGPSFKRLRQPLTSSI
jgi:hypothetical protein